MKSLRLFISAAMLIFGSADLVEARLLRVPSEEELFAKSDLVVVATPTRTHDTAEHLADFLDFHGQPVVGVETTFAVSSVLKGDHATKELILCHYRPDKISVPNGPGFIFFDPTRKQAFRLYLVRLRNGRYAPVAGQKDADLSVKRSPRNDPLPLETAK